MPDDVVDNPAIEIISSGSKLWGLSEKTKYSPFDCPGYTSTPSITLEATLILLTDLPLILVIFAATPWPLVSSLLNTRVSLILYSDPPVTIPTLSIVPGEVAVTVAVWSNLFGI